MTAPQFDAAAAKDALQTVNSLVANAPELADEPGIVYSLAAIKANPSEAGAINQFTNSMNLQRQVEIHRASGTPLLVSAQDQALMNTAGVDYKGVAFTAADYAQQTAQQWAAANPNLQVMKNADGTLVMDAQGNPVVNNVGGGYKAKGIGRFFQTIHNDFIKPTTRDIPGLSSLEMVVGEGAGPAIKAISTPLNAVQTELSQGAQQFGSMFTGNSYNPISNLQDEWRNQSATQTEDMKLKGYDPSNPMSVMAYGSSGRNLSDTSGLVSQYGQKAVDDAMAYAANPQAYKLALYNNPANYTTDPANPNGPKIMTAAGAAAVKRSESKEFTDMVRRVDAQASTVGNATMNSIGLDPVAHPDIYRDSTAALNVVASFALDPTLMAGRLFRMARFAELGSTNALADAPTVAARIRDTNPGMFLKPVQARIQSFLDLGTQIREASAAGDHATVDALTARVNSEFNNSYAPLLPDIMGHDQLVEGVHPNGQSKAWEEVTGADGKPTLRPVTGEGEPITTLNQFADYVENRYALLRLSSGKAARESTLMPGALSNMGLSKLRGLTAEWLTHRSAVRSLGQQEARLSRAEIDPAFLADQKAKGFITDGDLARTQPEVNNAVDALTGNVIASPEDSIQAIQHPGTTMLASQQRALSLTAAGKGDVADEARRGFSPSAIAARQRMVAGRLGTLLPRNLEIDIADSQSGEKIRRFAAMYLPRGEQYALQAAWNNGTEAARKTIIQGIQDQVAHASGITKTPEGLKWWNDLRDAHELYTATGDEAILNGKPIARYNGQVNDKWTLPSFNHYRDAASKIGLYGPTFGRVMESGQVDWLMGMWKMGMIGKPSTITRNMIEAWGRTALEGGFGDAIKARVALTTPYKELWAGGHDADKIEEYHSIRGEIDGLKQTLTDTAAKVKQDVQTRKNTKALIDNAFEPDVEVEKAIEDLKTLYPVDKGTSALQRQRVFDRIIDIRGRMERLEVGSARIQHMLAVESGDEVAAKRIANSSMLSGGLGRARSTEWAVQHGGLALVGRAYRQAFGRYMNPEEVQAIINKPHHELVTTVNGFGQQSTEAVLGKANAAAEAAKISKGGFGPVSFKQGFSDAWESARRETQDTTKTGWDHQTLDGADGAYRWAGALARRYNAMPLTTKALLNAVEDPELGTDEIVKALEQEARHTDFGKVWLPRGSAEHIAAKTPDEVLLGKHQWADSVLADTTHMMVGKDGEYLQELADHMRETGKAPDIDWIVGHIPEAKRPAVAEGLKVMAMPNGGTINLPEALQDVTGKAFELLVTRPLERTTMAPVTMAYYGKARVALNAHVEDLVGQGFSREAASNFADELATKQSWMKAEMLVDDPGQRTQFDIVARNFFPFSRAMQAMIRRWGMGLWRDPTRARKMMLAYEGATHSGLVYNNTYGEPTYTLPTSGVTNMMFRGIADIPGMENFARFPISGDMTGAVFMSVPGADNPFRLSMGPMASIPLREIAGVLVSGNIVDASTVNNIDSFINGPIGAGQTWNQLLPTSIRRFYQAFTPNDRNGALSSAVVGAMQNLAAAGMQPAPNASLAENQQWQNRIKTQVQNQMYLRAVFGLVAPASPSTPTEATKGSSADYSFQQDGIKGLSDEFKTILNDVNGDFARASAIFTTLHPDHFVFDPKTGALVSKEMPSEEMASKSVNPATGSNLSSTDATYNWINSNQSFITKYENVAAYFVPTSASTGKFSDVAHNLEIEMGLRNKLSPSEFLNNMQVRHAENTFYPTMAQFDTLIANAKASGASNTVTQLNAEKKQFSDAFQNLNPLFKQKLTQGYGDHRAAAQDQMGNLVKMLQDGDVPGGNAPLLDALLQSYNGLEAYLKASPGTTDQANAAKAAAHQTFDNWVQQNIVGTQLANLYQGVFYPLDTNNINITQGAGS